MKQLYFDTNIFIYLFDATSIHHKSCQNLVNYCQEEDITILTCTETFQEIIHFSKNIKQPEKGLETANIAFEITDQIIPVTSDTIRIYLKQVAIYKNLKSRDIIHYAVCLENKLDKLVTLDHEFKKFTNIKILKPIDIIN